MFPCMSRKCPNCIGTCFKIQVGQWGYGKAADIRSGGTNRITRGLVLTRPSVDRKKAHLCTTNTFISILFLREESSRQRYLDSYLQDNSGDMQYSASNPVRTEFHFSALHHGDYDVSWAELWFVVCGCVLVR